MREILRALLGQQVRLMIGTPYPVTGKVESIGLAAVTIHHGHDGTRSYVRIDSIISINADKKVT